MTMPNTIKGKLSYTAPELALGEMATAQSDIFSLGVTLWECLAARKLFAGKSNLEVIEAIYQWNVSPLAPLRPDIPLDVVQVVTRAIAKNPENRFSCSRDLGAALKALLLRDPVDADRLGATVRAARERLAEMDGGTALQIEDSMILEDVSAPDARPTGGSQRPLQRPPPPPTIAGALRAAAAPTASRPLAAASRRAPPAPAQPRSPSKPLQPAASKTAAASKPAGGGTGLGLLGAMRPAPVARRGTAASPPSALAASAGAVPGTNKSLQSPVSQPAAPEAKSPIAKILSERPSPSIREVAPHEAHHLSVSDLFEARIQGVLDTSASPSSPRMARRKVGSESVQVLDHASSWDIPVPDGAEDNKSAT
jgi:serine/threonine-protein kinase